MGIQVEQSQYHSQTIREQLSAFGTAEWKAFLWHRHRSPDWLMEYAVYVAHFHAW